MNWLDLHMHSNKSNDGEFTPSEIVQQCFDNGLKVMSLTDHNSVKGVIEAMEYGKNIGVEVITGVELDCSFGPYNLHLLGYGIQVPNQRINDIEEDLSCEERKASEQIMNKITELGIIINREEAMSLADNGHITPVIIAEVVIKDKRNQENPLLKPFFKGGERSDNPYANFYWDFCAIGKPAYVPIKYISLDQAIKLIKDSGGIPVLAHPAINIGCNEEVIVSIIEAGIKGVEVYSNYHDLETVTFYDKIADKYKLIKSLGSDYHGKIKPSIRLGQIVCSTQEKIYEALVNELL